jgi:hypothetical protein
MHAVARGTKERWQTVVLTNAPDRLDDKTFVEWVFLRLIGVYLGVNEAFPDEDEHVANAVLKEYLKQIMQEIQDLSRFNKDFRARVTLYTRATRVDMETPAETGWAEVGRTFARLCGRPDEEYRVAIGVEQFDDMLDAAASLTSDLA